MSKQLTPDMVASSKPALADGVERFTAEDGATHLRGPVIKRGRFGNRLAGLFRRPLRIEVELDVTGAWVAERIDGAHTMAELASELAAHLKLSRREAEAGVTAFLRMLLKRRLVRLDFQENGA